MGIVDTLKSLVGMKASTQQQIQEVQNYSPQLTAAQRLQATPSSQVRSGVYTAQVKEQMLSDLGQQEQQFTQAQQEVQAEVDAQNQAIKDAEEWKTAEILVQKGVPVQGNTSLSEKMSYIYKHPGAFDTMSNESKARTQGSFYKQISDLKAEGITPIYNQYGNIKEFQDKAGNKWDRSGNLINKAPEITPAITYTPAIVGTGSPNVPRQETIQGYGVESVPVPSIPKTYSVPVPQRVTIGGPSYSVPEINVREYTVSDVVRAPIQMGADIGRASINYLRRVGEMGKTATEQTLTDLGVPLTQEYTQTLSLPYQTRGTSLNVGKGFFVPSQKYTTTIPTLAGYLPMAVGAAPELAAWVSPITAPILGGAYIFSGAERITNPTATMMERLTGAGEVATGFLFGGYSSKLLGKIPRSKLGGLSRNEVDELFRLSETGNTNIRYYSLREKALNGLRRKGDEIGIKAFNQLFPGEVKITWTSGEMYPSYPGGPITNLAQQEAIIRNLQAERLAVTGGETGMEQFVKLYPQVGNQVSAWANTKIAEITKGEKILTKGQAERLASALLKSPEGQAYFKTKEFAVRVLMDSSAQKFVTTTRLPTAYPGLVGSLGDIPKILRLPELKSSPWIGQYKPSPFYGVSTRVKTAGGTYGLNVFLKKPTSVPKTIQTFFQKEGSSYASIYQYEKGRTSTRVLKDLNRGVILKQEIFDVWKRQPRIVGKIKTTWIKDPITGKKFRISNIEYTKKLFGEPVRVSPIRVIRDIARLKSLSNKQLATEFNLGLSVERQKLMDIIKKGKTKPYAVKGFDVIESEALGYKQAVNKAIAKRQFGINVVSRRTLKELFGRDLGGVYNPKTKKILVGVPDELLYKISKMKPGPVKDSLMRYAKRDFIATGRHEVAHKLADIFGTKKALASASKTFQSDILEWARKFTQKRYPGRISLQYETAGQTIEEALALKAEKAKGVEFRGYQFTGKVQPYIQTTKGISQGLMPIKKVKFNIPEGGSASSSGDFFTSGGSGGGPTKTAVLSSKSTDVLIGPTPTIKTNKINIKTIPSPSKTKLKPNLAAVIIPKESIKATTGTKVGNELIVKPRQDIRVVSNQKSGQIQVLEPIQSLQPLEALRPLEQTRQQQQTQQTQKSASQQIQVLRQLQVSQAITVIPRPITSLVPKTPPPRTPRIRIPTPPEDEFFKKRKVKPKFGQAFIPLVKKRGKYIVVGAPSSRGEAIRKGETITRATAAASFKIVPAKGVFVPGGKETAEPSSLVFRSYKIRGKRTIPLTDEWIQKRSKRISSAGEVSEISLKGMQARRRTSIW